MTDGDASANGASGREESDPAAFYDAYGEAEWERLATGIDGRLEWERTTAELERELPDSGRVLDAGGGAGRYAVWLAERGHDVVLADLSAEQLAIARRTVAERGVADRVDLARGTVAELGLADDAFDAALCLGGPISHLLASADRRRAAGELRRVTVPGGPVCVSVMGLLGFVQLQLATGRNVRAMPDLLEHGDYDEELLAPYGYENAFTATHFFRRAELADLLADAGLDVDRIVGLEGLGSVFHDEAIAERVESLPGAERDAVVATAHALAEDSAVADLSIHVFAACRA